MSFDVPRFVQWCYIEGSFVTVLRSGEPQVPDNPYREEHWEKRAMSETKRQPLKAKDSTASMDDMRQMLILARGGAWIGLAAMLIATLAVLLVIFWVKVPTHVTAGGYEAGDQIVCYIDVDHIDDLKVGQVALIDQRLSGVVTDISRGAYSAAEAKEQIQDEYARHLMEISEWSVRVSLRYEGKLDDETVHMVVITTGEIPLSSLFVGAGS